MQTILFVIPSLDYGGAARQLTLIAEGLPRPFPQPSLRPRPRRPLGEGITHRRRRSGCFGMETAVRSGAVFRAASLAGRTAARRGSLLGPHRPAHRRGRRRCSRRRPVVCQRRPAVGKTYQLVRRLAVASGGCGHGVRRSGGRPLPSSRRPHQRVAVIAPGVRPSPLTPNPSPRSTGERGERLLLGVGPIEPHKGFRDAVWALDILHYLYDDLRLVLAGDGSDRPHWRSLPTILRWISAWFYSDANPI